MTQGEMGRVTELRNRLCAKDPPPPVTVVDMEHYEGGASVAGSASSQSLQSQRGHGKQSQCTRAHMGQPPHPAAFKEEPPPPALAAET